LRDLWIVVGNSFIGAFLAWMVLGRRTRRMTQNLDVMTMPEFLHERFQGRYIKMICAVIIFVFLLPYCASVFKGLGHLFEASFHIPYDVALLIMIAVTGIYLILGGYFAIVLTDFIQGFVMLVGSVALVWILSGKAGGFVQSFSLIAQKYAEHVPAAKQPGWLPMAALVFMTSFGVWGLPQMVQKFYAIKNEKMIRVAALVTLVFSLVITFAAYYTGALAHVFFDSPVMVNGKPAFDRIIPALLTAQLHPAFLALILLLVLSASMSTLSSLVLVSASAIAIDLYKGHYNPAVSKENSVAMMRFLSGVFIVIAYYIARYDFAFIVTLMSLSWGAVAGAFLAPFVYALYWKRTTKAGVKAGMATGLVLAIVLFFMLGQNNSPLASSIAMLVPFAVVPLVSLFTRPPDAKLLHKAFEHIK
jgi:solute:Na+ symporter, SSS family